MSTGVFDCAGEPGCAEKLTVQLDKSGQPIGVMPYVCLACWLAGWRVAGGEAFKVQQNEPRETK